MYNADEKPHMKSASEQIKHSTLSGVESSQNNDLEKVVKVERLGNILECWADKDNEGGES